LTLERDEADPAKLHIVRHGPGPYSFSEPEEVRMFTLADSEMVGLIRDYDALPKASAHLADAPGFGSTAGQVIAGTITPASIGVGTKITLAPAGGFVLADEAGHYEFEGVDNGSYTVTPSKDNYTFDPASRTVTVRDADATGIDFKTPAK
jgi:hypothetical protein